MDHLHRPAQLTPFSPTRDLRLSRNFGGFGSCQAILSWNSGILDPFGTYLVGTTKFYMYQQIYRPYYVTSFPHELQVVQL